MKPNNTIADIYLFEAIDRITRFYIHLDAVKNQFYEEDKSNYKVQFIQEFKNCLFKLLEMVVRLIKLSESTLNEAGVSAIIARTEAILGSVGKLHNEALHYLPRPAEPVELERFKRIIEEQHLNRLGSTLNEPTWGISFFPTESIGVETYKKNALYKFEDTINEEIKKYNAEIKSTENLSYLRKEKNLTEEISPLETSTANGNFVHITIPRIDSNNPCRWPTLIHEIAHHIIRDDLFKKNIREDFKDKYGESPYLASVFKGNDEKLHSWLLECWCDIFAALVMGPAFWFSQYSTFLFVEASNQNAVVASLEYPPANFRLNLIYSILQHRGKLVNEPVLNDIIKNNKNLFNWLLNKKAPALPDDNIDGIYILFKLFYHEVFYKEGANEKTEYNNLNEVVKNYIKESTEIKMPIVLSLVEDLANGLPICSVRRSLNMGIINESYTTLPEILLSSWIFRETSLRENILKECKMAPDCDNPGSAEDFARFYKEKIIKNHFKRFDQSVLRSIQVSEWFKLFSKKNEVNPVIVKNPINDNDHNYNGMLVDFEIINLINEKKLRVIPLIDINEQLGTSSLDVRLGTSFQIFHPNVTGTIDFTDAQKTPFDDNSKYIDLDYLESIDIQPGQFVLAHTMEWIKLPDIIAAEIDGRSSFARLGLAIHMTAGYIDPGFEGVITLEIHNAGSLPIRLYPGMRIAQLRFIAVNNPEKPYSQRHKAKYKGFLTHNKSLQSKDFEVKCIREEKMSRQIAKR